MKETVFAIFMMCGDGSLCEEGSKFDTMAHCKAAIVETYTYDWTAHCREIPFDGKPRDIGPDLN